MITKSVGGSVGGQDLTKMNLDLMNTAEVDLRPYPAATFASLRNEVLATIEDPATEKLVEGRLSVLNPKLPDPKGGPLTVPGEEVAHEELTAIFHDLACSPDGAPFVAAGLIRSDILMTIGEKLPKFTEYLKNPKGSDCPGAEGLSAGLLGALDRQSHYAAYAANLTKAFNAAASKIIGRMR